MNQSSQSIRISLALIFAGVLFMSVPLVAYFAVTQSITILTIQSANRLEYFSYFVLAILLAGIFSTFIGGLKFLRDIQANASSEGAIRTSIVVARVLNTRRYFVAMTLVAAAYAIFYAFVSGIIVYRPGENFAVEYYARIPSFVVSVCCGPVGYLPAFTVYVTNNLGFLIIPSNIILMLLVSVLVGVNAALILGEYDNRPKFASKRWLAGLGAITGLFTACPTCASVFFAGIAGGLGTTAAVSALVNSQPLFVAATIPLLLLSALLSSANLKKLLNQSCIIEAKRSTVST
jgi:hypothetical protein